jgi:hypothetical protein
LAEWRAPRCLPGFSASTDVRVDSGRLWSASEAFLSSGAAHDEVMATRDRRYNLLGTDALGNQHDLSFIWFGDQVIWAKTAVRPQNVEFPSYDLLNEIATCELGIKLAKFRRGEISSISTSQFERIHTDFCRRFKATPSHTMGGYPFNCSWTPEFGFRL